VINVSLLVTGWAAKIQHNNLSGEMSVHCQGGAINRKVVIGITIPVLIVILMAG